MQMTLKKFLAAMSKFSILAAMLVTILLSFYWSFGFQPYEITTIVTTDITVEVTLDPKYLLALSSVCLFYMGYRLYASRERTQEVEVVKIETRKQLIVKYVLAIMLGGIGLWITSNEFSNVPLWAYDVPSYVAVSTQSQAMHINAVIATLLLLLWLLIVRIRIEFGHKMRLSEKSNEPQ